MGNERGTGCRVRRRGLDMSDGTDRGGVPSGYSMDVATRMREVFARGRFIHIVARDVASYWEGSTRVGRACMIESWMGADRVRSVARGEDGGFVGGVLVVDGRATEVARDGRRVEYAMEGEDGRAAAVDFPRLLDDEAQHALGDYLASWVTPETDDDLPTWIVEAVARGVWRGREGASEVGAGGDGGLAGGECDVFEDVHVLPHRRVRQVIRVDVRTGLPTSVVTSSSGRDGGGGGGGGEARDRAERSVLRGYVTMEVLEADPGWAWTL